MSEVLADTAYFAALLSADDDLHDLALLHPEEFERKATTVLVTTDAVLVELLSLFCERGPGAREAAAQLVTALLDSNAVVVLPQTRDRLRSGLALYAARLDKGWSRVDCLSMVAMEERGIRDVLSHDHHFSQAGYSLLL